MPYYWFNIALNENIVIGKISIRIGENFHSYYNGNIGHEIDEKYRGHNYAYIASIMVLEIARYHEMKSLYLVCDNLASKKTKIKLGGILKEEKLNHWQFKNCKVIN